MLKPAIEQCVDKSVNVYLGDLLFKLPPTELGTRPNWKIETDHGYETIENHRVTKWLNLLWLKKVYWAPRPPTIQRFPRKDHARVTKLMSSAEKAYKLGDERGMDAIAEQLKSLVTKRPNCINRWNDLPLASEAPEEKLKWLAKNRIPLRQVTVIVAAKDSYKSMLMLALAKAATTDGKFLGSSVRQLRVLYLNRDMPKAVFDDYCRTLKLDKCNPRFKILSSLWDTRIEPMEPDDPLLLRFARRYKPLIIFDHLAKFCKGKLDNELAVQGATVIVLHHVPKNDATSEGFGSVYIINGADFGWNMTREGGAYASEQATVLRIQNTKTKMGDYFRLKVRPRLKRDGTFEIKGEKSEEKEKWDRDIKKFTGLLAEDEWTEKRELQKLAMTKGFSRNKFGDLCTFCVDRGLVDIKNAESGLKLCRLHATSDTQ